MTPSTTPPAPAARLLRTAAGRRALQLALLLGGLVALGLLCGGRAHADDTSTALAPRAAAVGERVAEPVERVAEPVREARARVVEPVREKVVRPAVDTARKVTEPVGDAELIHAATDIATGVTGTVSRVTGDAVGGLASVTPEPLPSGAADLPALPELPAPPGQSEPPAAQPAPAPPASPAPHHADPAPRSGARPAEAPAGPAAYGTAWFGDVHGTHPHHADAAGRIAVHPAEPGVPARPDGIPSANASAGDGGSTRHGDLHAAAFGARVPVLLPPGALASGRPAPVADRHRDIPEFPG
ncbi:hypothetical protein [Streptomyces sp. NPDC052225]|uniref:hypothetical protein n=1 Tax=Streptomyces sp. NPDC052225 TaxID=3154949 RepID=UPI00342A7044